MKLYNFCNKAIEYSFYLLFFLVPLAFTMTRSELFELTNFGVTFYSYLLLSPPAWITKMVLKRHLEFNVLLYGYSDILFLISELFQQ